MAEQLTTALRDDWRADYVYTYPPRQAYTAIEGQTARDAAAESLSKPGALNLYAHVPFCRQICSYCNLYAVAGRHEDDHQNYVDLVERELHQWNLTGHKSLDTIYIGGGTPSLLRPELLARLVESAAVATGHNLANVSEVALEVAPDTVDQTRLSEIRDTGINRINLGVQSWDDNEIHGIGRSHGSDIHDRVLSAAMRTGFDNVCVDLIYGLPGQSMTSWRESLLAVIEHDPDTICCYALTMRANTGYAAQGQPDPVATDQYIKYDLAVDILADAGYEQETHVRWIRPGRGGYLQKTNHWAGQNIVGVGAGARSYLRTADLRNGYSSRRRRRVLTDWVTFVHAGRTPIIDGYLINEDERARKAIILGLGHLVRRRFANAHGHDPVTMFEAEIEILAEHGLVNLTPTTISWTPLGQRHRDVAVQLFFSDEVSARIKSFDYASE